MVSWSHHRWHLLSWETLKAFYLWPVFRSHFLSSTLGKKISVKLSSCQLLPIYPSRSSRFPLIWQCPDHSPLPSESCLLKNDTQLLLSPLKIGEMMNKKPKQSQSLMNHRVREKPWSRRTRICACHPGTSSLYSRKSLSLFYQQFNSINIIS